MTRAPHTFKNRDNREKFKTNDTTIFLRADLKNYRSITNLWVIYKDDSAEISDNVSSGWWLSECIRVSSFRTPLRILIIVKAEAHPYILTVKLHSINYGTPRVYSFFYCKFWSYNSSYCVVLKGIQSEGKADRWKSISLENASSNVDALCPLIVNS